MALDKVLKIYDENGNPVDYDILASDVKFLPDSKDLPTKLTEMEDAIEDAAESGGYTPPQGGIPKTDLAPSVQTSLGLADTALQEADKTQLQNAINSLQSALDTLIGSGNVQGAIDTFNEVKAFLDGIDTDDPTLANQLLALSNAITALQNTLSTKANDNAVVKSISVNGGTPQTPQNGNVNIQVQTGSTISPATDAPIEDGTANVGSSAKYAREDHVHPHDTTKLSKSDVSVETQGDGTVDFNVMDDTYKINLNHTHEGMAKLIVCEESDLPSTLAKDTIYAQVDDAETPTEIQSLWIAGLEFVGGGGAIDDTPRLISPRDGLTLDFDGQSTIQLPVRGKNLLSDLSLTVTGDFTVTDGNNAAVSTITATAANNGVVLRLTKGSNYNSGTLRIFSSEVDVTVTLEIDTPLPAGYSPLEAVAVNSMILSLANTNIPILSSWRLVLRSSSSSSSAQIALCQAASRAGRYFGVVAGSKWGVATSAAIDGVSATTKTEALVEFGNSLTKLTIGDNVTTITPATLVGAEGKQIELFGCSAGVPYYFSGYVYEIECVSGGLFHAFPAKRLSDNAIGLYDIENDVFYTGFSL